MAEVLRRVARLLERAQHEGRQRRAPVAGARTCSSTSIDASRDDLGRLRAATCARAPAASARRATRAARAAARPRRGSGRSWTRYSVGMRALVEQRRRPPRWRRSSGARSRGATRSGPLACGARDVPGVVEGELRLDGLDRQRAARRARRVLVERAARRRARRGQRRAPTGRSARLGARRRSGRPGRSPGARPSGSPSGGSVALTVRAPCELQLGRHRQPVARRERASRRRWRAPRAASARPSPGT